MNIHVEMDEKEFEDFKEFKRDKSYYINENFKLDFNLDMLENFIACEFPDKQLVAEYNDLGLAIKYSFKRIKK